jgi:hypothetical protein
MLRNGSIAQVPSHPSDQPALFSTGGLEELLLPQVCDASAAEV